MRRVLREERNKVVVFIISTFILGLVEVSFATIIQKFIDSLESSDITKFKLAIFSFVVFLVINYVLNLFVIWIQSVLTKNIHLYLKSNLAKYFLSLCYCDFSETTTGEKMNYFDYKISLIEQYYLDSIFSMIQAHYNTPSMGFPYSFFEKCFQVSRKVNSQKGQADVKNSDCGGDTCKKGAKRSPPPLLQVEKKKPGRTAGYGTGKKRCRKPISPLDFYFYRPYHPVKIHGNAYQFTAYASQRVSADPHIFHRHPCK